MLRSSGLIATESQVNCRMATGEKTITRTITVNALVVWLICRRHGEGDCFCLMNRKGLNLRSTLSQVKLGMV